MPGPNSNPNAKVLFEFDVELTITPDERPGPVVNFDATDGLPNRAGDGLLRAETAIGDESFFDVEPPVVPVNDGLLDA